jgi:hypothetical protein
VRTKRNIFTMLFATFFWLLCPAALSEPDFKIIFFKLFFFDTHQFTLNLQFKIGCAERKPCQPYVYAFRYINASYCDFPTYAQLCILVLPFCIRDRYGWGFQEDYWITVLQDVLESWNRDTCSWGLLEWISFVNLLAISLLIYVSSCLCIALLMHMVCVRAAIWLVLLQTTKIMEERISGIFLRGCKCLWSFVSIN